MHKVNAVGVRLMRIPVLFENESCLVLNKPAGLPVQGGEGIKVSLDSILSENYSPKPLLVHRLDRDTSGVILVARTQKAAAGFSALFSGGRELNYAMRNGEAGGERLLKKNYLGVCSGVPAQDQGVIKLALEVSGKGRAKVKKETETFYRLLSSVNVLGETFPLLELELVTGRMHQIRRHLAYLGCPLLGDDKYGDFSLNKKLRKENGLKNLLLHSSRLIIPPLPELIPEGLNVNAPLPDYFLKWVDLSLCFQ